MPRTLSSLELVLDLIHREREKQRAHFDALDNKAGLAVGFAALLVTLVPDLGIPYSLLVVLAALCAGGFGLASFWPRRYPVLSARRLRAYVAAEQQLTRKVVVDTLVEVNDETAAMLSTKGVCDGP